MRQNGYRNVFMRLTEINDDLWQIRLELEI